MVDNDYTVLYRSDDALPLTAEQMRNTENGSLMLDGGIRLSGSGIRGGHTLWQENLSELLEVLDELRELRAELEGSNAVSMQKIPKPVKAITTFTIRRQLYIFMRLMERFSAMTKNIPAISVIG